MSNLSDVGFTVKSNEDVNSLVENCVKNVEQIPCSKGAYLKFSDVSGVEIYLQMDHGGELTGFNPYFNGKSKRQVFVTKLIERDSSPLDGGFHAWSNSTADGEGDYPFVFDLPNVFTNTFELPNACEIQLNAFASNDLTIFDDEESYYDSNAGEFQCSSQSFVPTGLFRENDDIPPQAHAKFAGTIKKFELKINQTSGEQFYYFLVETLGGEIDVVSDVSYVKNEPKIGGILHGSFWLTGKIV
jgi:hypothetical protein